MEQGCLLESHDKKPIILICANPRCTKNRLLCFRCLETQHQECLKHILEVEDIYKRSLPANINWIASRDIKQAVLTVCKDHSGAMNERLLETLERLIDQDFTKLMDCIAQKLKEIKAKVLKTVKRRLNQEEPDLKNFESYIKSLYNFDALLGMLDSYRCGEKSQEKISEELAQFFNYTSVKETEEKKLSETAVKINSLTQELLLISQRSIENLQDSLPAELFITEKPKVWSWDPNKKSDAVALKENNMVAMKTAYYSTSPKVVLGNLQLSKSHHKWAIDLTGSTSHMPCWMHMSGHAAILGIIQSDLIPDNQDKIDPYDVYGFSLKGEIFNVEQISNFTSYRNKIYEFDLDLENNSLTISSDGEVLFSNKNLEKSIYYPVVILYCVHDRITLRL